MEALPTHVLVNSKGTEVHISPVGAAIERLNVPDRNGKLTDIVLGFDRKTPYAVSYGRILSDEVACISEEPPRHCILTWGLLCRTAPIPTSALSWAAVPTALQTPPS